MSKSDELNTEASHNDLQASPTLSRRSALLRLGLAVGAAYATPSLLRIDREAKAGVLPSFCPPPGSPLPPPPGCELSPP